MPFHRLRNASVFATIVLLFVGTGGFAATDQTVDVTQLGVVGDGLTLNTLALQRAIDDCSAHGGGVLQFPHGHYVTGTLQLKDGVTLRLALGAELVGSVHASDYRNVDPFIDGTGAALGYALITAIDANRVGLEGPGVIDGSGAALKADQNPYVIRPFLIRFVHCSNVVMREITLRNAGAWATHFFQVKNALVDRVTIRSRGLPNNDGIDIDSSEGVRIADCDIDTGDDAVCLKTTSMHACSDITVTGCRLSSSCAAFKIGTESRGEFTQVRVSNCTIHDTRLGGIKLTSVDGAQLHDVVISDITMERVTVPIMLRLGARLKVFRSGETAGTVGALRNVTIRNVRGVACTQIGILMSGIPGHPIEDVTLQNIDLQLAGGGLIADASAQLPESASAYPEIRMFGSTMPAFGIYARHVRGLTLGNVRVGVSLPDARPEKLMIDVDVTEFSHRPPAGDAPGTR